MFSFGSKLVIVSAILEGPIAGGEVFTIFRLQVSEHTQPHQNRIDMNHFFSHSDRRSGTLKTHDFQSSREDGNFLSGSGTITVSMVVNAIHMEVGMNSLRHSFLSSDDRPFNGNAAPTAPTLSTHRFAILLSILCSLYLSTTALAQVQVGTDIDGKAVYDESGGAVALSADGQHLAVGARLSNGNGIKSGHVRVFERLNNSWLQIGNDIEGEAAYDEFGGAVAWSLDGQRLAIGAPLNDGNGSGSGHVRVFQFSATDWVQLGADIDGEAAYDESGGSVSLSSRGNRLAIGARLNDGTGFNAGHTRVYQWSGVRWEPLGDDIDGEAAYDESGVSVSISSDGNRLVIGADGNDGSGIDAGHARVYQWTNAQWQQIGGDINGEAFGDYFGHSVALSSDGTRLAAGAPFNINSNGTNAGHVRVYYWSGVIWGQLGTDIDGEAAYDESGGSVSISTDGKLLAIGAHRNDGSGLNAGHARVFEWSGAAWKQFGIDINGEAAEDASGFSVSLASYGNQLTVGAPLNDGNGIDSGHTRVFDIEVNDGFRINAGLNDAWYDPVTNGQGFFITVFADLGFASLAWFTYDTELPPNDAEANLGDPGHRWMTAVGPIVGNQVRMNIEMTAGGLFDKATEIERTDPPGSGGTIVLTFYNCNSGTVEYDITSIDQQGTVPIQRVAGDNIAFCELFNEN